MIDVILLDYAGVITRDYQEVDYPAELARKFNISSEDLVRTNQQHSAMAGLCLGDLREEEVSELVVTHNPGATYIEPSEFVTQNYHPDPETLNRLEKIKSSGLARLALVSNIFPASVQYLRERGVDAYFDWLFLSCDMGDKKPNESYFKTILQECGVKPNASLFLDDTPGNINTAQSLGIPSQLISDRYHVHRILDEVIYA